MQSHITTAVLHYIIYNDLYYAGIEFKDFILGFRQSTFLCTTLKCIEKCRIPFIKSGIPASNLGSSEARNPAKFAACYDYLILLYVIVKLDSHYSVMFIN